jgi:hypothetical protein
MKFFNLLNENQIKAYNPRGIDNKSSIKIGTSQRGQMDREALLIPGPGSYDPRDVTKPHNPTVR